MELKAYCMEVCGDEGEEFGGSWGQSCRPLSRPGQSFIRMWTLHESYFAMEQIFRGADIDTVVVDNQYLDVCPKVSQLSKNVQSTLLD